MLGLGNIKNRVQQSTLAPVSMTTTTKPEQVERRRSSRVEIEMLLTATTVDGMVFHGYTRDLSREGTLAFLRGGEFSVGDEIFLNFRNFQGEENVAIRATVRSAVGERFGIEFCDSDTSQHDDILMSVCKQYAYAEAGSLVGCN